MPSRIQIAGRLADLSQIKHKAVREVPDFDQIIRDNLEILAALIFAKMKGKSSVEEESSGVLVIKNDEGSWKIILKDEVLSLSGFRNAPNLIQFLAKSSPEKKHDSGFWIKIAETTIKLIERSYAKETKPPVKFQSPQSPGGEEDSGNIPSGSLAPATPEQGAVDSPDGLGAAEEYLSPDDGLEFDPMSQGASQPGGPAGNVVGDPSMAGGALGGGPTTPPPPGTTLSPNPQAPMSPVNQGGF